MSAPRIARDDRRRDPGDSGAPAARGHVHWNGISLLSVTPAADSGPRENGRRGDGRRE